MACPFPTPAHIHNLLAEEKSAWAEMMWQQILSLIYKRYHPDLGWRGLQIDDEFIPAVNAAGGVPYLWNASGEQLIWAKKEFIAQLTRRTS